MLSRFPIFLAALLAASLAHAAPAHAPKAVVHVVHDPAATARFEPDDAVVARLVDSGLRALTGKTNSRAAWRALVATNDTVGFRVCSGPGAISGTRPAVVGALVRSLLDAGHPPRRVVVWDRRASDLILSGHAALADRLGVRWAATEEAGWDASRSYESGVQGHLLVGDLEYGKTGKDVGRRSHVSKLLARDVTKIVVVAPLLNHGSLGVHGQLANLALGSVDNTLRFESKPELLQVAVPEICALDDLAPRLLFGVCDALVCQYRGEERTLLHYAAALNELRFSFDPVALDVTSLEEIKKARAANPIEGEKDFKSDLYYNAGLQELGVADPARIEVRRH